MPAQPLVFIPEVLTAVIHRVMSIPPQPVLCLLPAPSPPAPLEREACSCSSATSALGASGARSVGSSGGCCGAFPDVSQLPTLPWRSSPPQPNAPGSSV